MKSGAILQLAKESGRNWVQDKAPTLAAALAYYSIFSIAPLLVISIAIASAVYGERAAQGHIVGQIQNVVGEQAAQTIQSMIANSRKSSGGTFATIGSIVVLIFASTGVFGQLKDALNTVWNVESPRTGGVKGFIRTRLLSFTLVLGIGFLLLVSLVLSAVISAVTRYAEHLLPVPSYVLHLGDIALSLVIFSLLFAMIFKLLPDAEVAWSDVTIGAVATAVLFVIGKYGIGLYMGYSSVSSSYGAAGSVVILLLWIYYSSLILLLGAEFTQAYATRYGSRVMSAQAGRSHVEPSFRARLQAAGSTAAAARQASFRESAEQEGEEMQATEVDYLHDEQSSAQAAMKETLDELRCALSTTANPVAWTRQYPWAAVGVAALAGVVVGGLVLHKPVVAARREGWRGLVNSLTPDHTEGGRARDRRRDVSARDTERRGMGSALLAMLATAAAGALKTALQGALATAVATGTATKTAQAVSEKQPG